MTGPSGDIEDKVLWQSVKTGSKSYFNELFRRYYPEMHYYGIKIFPDEDFIEECIQEVFIRIWETRENLADVQNLKAYLLVSLRRKIITKKNKSKRYTEIGNVENYSFLFEENEFVKHEEISGEIRQLLLKAINSLTKKQRELIMLFFFHGLSYPEIAAVVGISVQAARNLMYRTLIHLRKSLGEESVNRMQNMLLLFFLYIPAKKVE